MFVASKKQTISKKQLAKFIVNLRDIPKKISETLKLSTKIKEIANDEEIIILSRLQSYRGSMIAAPHTLRNMYEKLNAYPKIQKWLYQCIRSGSMNEQAYRYLKSLVITQNTRGMAREEISND